jgi:hypothetical protein
MIQDQLSMLENWVVLPIPTYVELVTITKWVSVYIYNRQTRM